MRHKYYYCDRYSPLLIDLLESNGIRYQLSDLLITFSVYDNCKNAKEIIERISEIIRCNPIITAEYTNSELMRAKYLVMRPRRQCIDITNPEEAYFFSCTWKGNDGTARAYHEEQKMLFSISNEPSIKTQTAFWSPDTGFSEIFADRRVYELVIDNKLTGIDFKSVILRNGEYSQNIYQMTTPNMISRECIPRGYGEEVLPCPLCGKERFSIDNTYQLRLISSKIELKNDLYMTERIFGEGITYPLYLISQRFYQLLKANKLTGNLILSPVAEII